MNHFRLDMSQFRAGFKAALPLWLAATPVAFTWVITGRSMGLGGTEIQWMSLALYSSSAQMATAQLYAAGASWLTILLTVITLNLHQLLYGSSLAQSMTLTRLERVVAAAFMSDGAYGLTIRNPSVSFLFGAECSLFLAWSSLTLLGLFASEMIGNLSALHLEFAAPLTFFVLLVTMLRTRTDAAVAVIAALVALLCIGLQLGGVVLLVAGLLGAFAGAWMATRA